MNAPEAGTIKELLVNEEDTVTVGQDLVKLELGGEPSGGAKEQGQEEPKEPAPKEQDTSSQPQGGQEQPKPQEPTKQESKPEPPKQESKPTPPPSKPTPPKEPKQEELKKESTSGSREERRVCLYSILMVNQLTGHPGQNEPHASSNRRAPQAIPKHCCLSHNLQRS